jgi:hypothetical protein
MPSGDLRYRVGFYKRGASSPDIPDYGGIPGYPDVAVFVAWGNIKPRLGGEAVLAGRLTGKNFVDITVRQDSNTNAVDVDWVAKNETTGELFNIRSVIDPHGGDNSHHLYWEMLCEKGVAT